MTVQTFSFRADSRGLRQILCLSRSVTQSVWPRFYLESLWEGEKPFLYSVYHWCVVPVCCSFVVLVALLNVLISGREQENLPLNFWIFQLEMLRNQHPIFPYSLFPLTPSSLFNEESQRQYLEQKHWCDTKGLNFLPVKHTNTRCILTFKKRLDERLTFCILSVYKSSAATSHK